MKQQKSCLASSYFDKIDKVSIDPRDSSYKSLAAIIQPNSKGNYSIDVVNGDGTNCKGLTAVVEQSLGTVSRKQIKREGKPDEGKASRTSRRNASR